MQVLTTYSRFTDAENQQIELPPAERSASVFGDLASSISSDSGVNGSGTLTVSLGAGSAAPPSQIAFSVTVSSPYATSVMVICYIYSASKAGVSSSNGACVLSSSILGPGRATTDLAVGGSESIEACSSRWWSAGPAGPGQPRLGLAGIPRLP
jgi:hypothetical protein